MNIKAKLIYKNEREQDRTNIIAEALAPDNVPGIKTIIEDDSATILFEGEKVGTILASLDDYLMNATIAEKVSYIIKEDFKENQQA